jgi:hypothetical protein
MFLRWNEICITNYGSFSFTLFCTQSIIQNRLYAKSHGEMCVHYARQLDSLGLWDSPKAKHAIAQCSRVISSWGKGLIGKPE